jgi:hypothetical protein
MVKPMLAAVVVLSLAAPRAIAADEAPAAVAADLKAMLTAIEANSLDGFIARGDAAFKSGMTRQALESVNGQLASRLKQGYHATFLGQLSQQGYAVYLWKLGFDDKKDDHLVKMAVKDAKVGGFWVQ